MKHLNLIFIIISQLVFTFSHAADTLYIKPCDMVAVNIFDEIVCLSQESATLRTYTGATLRDIYFSDENTSFPILQDPLQPVFDGADRIYLLDRASQIVFGWDRFLNIHSVTKLNDDIISPASFTVTSEHDWLIYDDFYGQILQIMPSENFHSVWGDKPVNGNLELLSINDFVIIYFKDLSKIRVSDVNGTTVNEYALPGSIDVERLFPLNGMSFALSGPDGVYIWKPLDNSLRYLSDMKHVVHCSKIDKRYRLISQEGVMIITP